MKCMKRIVPAMFFLVALTGWAQDEPRKDAEGCTDSPYVTRFPGSTINSCEHNQFDSYSMPVAKDADGNPVEKPIEGEVFGYDIATRPGTSSLQLYRNFHNALASAEWKFLYEDSPDRITAQKGPVYLYIEPKGDYYYVHSVKVEAMQQEVTADAKQMGDDIDKSGHVAVYGIQFDTGKAAILPASEPVLGEVQKLLENRPDLRIRIEGHTDNVGQRAANQALSERRAQAVMGWLIANGIDAGRLSAKGFADTQPVADNGSAEGRAKNRRVELVKQ